MIPLRRLVVGLLLALFVGLVVAPGAALLIGVSPFGLGNAIGAAAIYYLFTRWPRVARMVMRDAERLALDPFDPTAARRESHAAGLPFPEADGTLSFPPPVEPQLAASVVVDEGEPGRHVGGCQCIRVWGPGGPGTLAQDPRCKVLRKRS